MAFADLDLTSKFTVKAVSTVFDFEKAQKSLSEEQKTAADLARARRSFFLTGPAGTGKSQVIDFIKNQQNQNHVTYKVCAMTGVASYLIRGRTLHSTFRLDREDGDMSVDKFKAKVDETIQWQNQDGRRVQVGDSHQSYKFLKSIKALDVLILDEVSMMSPEFFDKLDYLLQKMRDSDKPFGGLCLILVGDFCQLPPVTKMRKIPFLFESKIFWHVMTEIVQLTKCFRQEDQSFVDLLNRLRLNQLTPEDHQKMQACLNRDLSKHGIVPTRFYGTNMNVDTTNRRELDLLKTESKKFVARKRVSKDKVVVSNQTSVFGRRPVQDFEQDKTFEATNMNAISELKVGAQVILRFNIDTEAGLYNGARGVVVGFAKHSCPDPESKFDVIETAETFSEDTGIGIHVDRVQMKQNLFVQPNEELPIVRFEDGSSKLIPQARFSRNFADKDLESGGEMAAHIWQLPLSLAWALTTHKGQGMTLNCVEMGTDDMFSHGQVYVGISRVKSLEGLSLRSWDSVKVKCDPRVVQFYTQSFGFLKAL